MGAVSPEKLQKVKSGRLNQKKENQFAGGGQVGLYANIHAKRKRIASGSGETMRQKGDKGSPTKDAFMLSKKTAKQG